MAARIAFYCHNVYGLGHIARSKVLAGAVVRGGGECLIVTGCRALPQINIPEPIAVRALTPLTARDRQFVALDGTPAHEVLRARAQQIITACRDWKPDILVADHSPFGLGGELLPMLTAAGAERWPTKFVWGVPYVEGTALDQAQPANPRARGALASYAAMLAYVPPGQAFFDRVPGWMLPRRREAVGFVGDTPAPPVTGATGQIVVTCGGGTTAVELCRDALAAWRRLPEPLPPLRLVVGPLGSVDDVRGLDHATAPGVEIRALGDIREVIRDAAVVISRSGYNSVALLLQTPLPIILSPAFSGSYDQVERVSALRGTPGVWGVTPDDPGPDRASGLHRALVEARAYRPAGPRLVADGAVNAARWLLAEALTGASSG